MAAEVETMFSARETPWHGLGNVTPEALTSAEAIVAGGLDWEVKLHSVYAQIGKDKKKIPNRFAIVRQTDGSIYNVVGQSYQPFQNREAFAFADSLVDSGEALYETAGSLKNGRIIFLTMKLPEQLLVAGEDAHDLYVMLRAGHDGLNAITAVITPIRAVCMNTVTAALRQAKHRWSMPHTRTMHGKVQEARETLNLSWAYADEFKSFADSLASVVVPKDQVKGIFEDVLPDLPRTPDTVEELMAYYESSPTNGYQGTAWGVYNAVTEYFDHGRATKTLEGRFNAIMDGSVAKIRNKTTDRLLALAN